MKLLTRSRITVALCLLMVAAISASAQTSKPLQGTFVMTGQNAAGGGLTNLIQFDKDGGVREETAGPLPPNTYASQGLVQWVRTGPNEFTVHVWFQVAVGDLANSSL